jgi:UPF0042 nucleotide-binding protein
MRCIYNVPARRVLAGDEIVTGAPGLARHATVQLVEQDDTDQVFTVTTRYGDRIGQDTFYAGPDLRFDIRRADQATDHIELVSFGYLHMPVAPQANRVIDVRESLRDPAAARDILHLDGKHPRVQQVVLNTAGAADLLDTLVDYATALPHHQARRIAIGCAGGRHRSAALVELAATRLHARGHRTRITHLHIDRPRVLRTTPAGGAA